MPGAQKRALNWDALRLSGQACPLIAIELKFTLNHLKGERSVIDPQRPDCSLKGLTKCSRRTLTMHPDMSHETYHHAFAGTFDP
jgi:hypothetical protein